MTEKREDKEASNETVSAKFAIGDVLFTVKPIFRLENYCGILRFCCIGKELEKTSWKQKLMCLVVTSVVIILFSSLIVFPSSISGTQDLVAAIDTVPNLVVLIQYVASAITATFFLCTQFINIMTSFAQLDSVLRINMNEGFYRNSRKHTIQGLVLMIIVHVIFGAGDHVTDETYTVFKSLVILLYIEQDLEIFMFCKMVLMLRSRLCVINDYLAKFIFEQEKKNSIFTINKKDVDGEKKLNFIGSSNVANTKIKDLASMYDVIGEICNMINDVFNFQIFMDLVSTFTFIVITIWTSLYYFRTPDKTSTAQLATIVMWCLNNLLSVACMAFACESLLTSRRNTKILVNEIIMDYDLPRTMRIQAKVFMELIEAWPLRIFVYDMFSIDISLMLKFISVATTYLIVVIQVSHFF